MTGAGDRSGFTSVCRFRGKRGTLDMVVIFDVLVFLTGARKRDFWTCGSFSEIGGSH